MKRLLFSLLGFVAIAILCGSILVLLQYPLVLIAAAGISIVVVSIIIMSRLLGDAFVAIYNKRKSK